METWGTYVETRNCTNVQQLHVNEYISIIDYWSNLPQLIPHVVWLSVTRTLHRARTTTGHSKVGARCSSKPVAAGQGLMKSEGKVRERSVALILDFLHCITSHGNLVESTCGQSLRYFLSRQLDYCVEHWVFEFT